MRVLIVEDDAAARRGLAELVRAWGYEAETAADGQEGLDLLTTYRPAAVLADMVMPRMDGLELLRRVKSQLSDLTFVLITAQGSVDTAVSAMKEGAYDYLTKPVDPQRLRTLLGHVAERHSALRDVASLRHQLQEHGRFGQMVGNAPAVRSVYKIIEQAAPTAASVLVHGESGTGKELVAKTIHELSGRSKHPFVAINCAAIPESLLENEIFGHERGAFTGAVERRPGCFELAHTGTLFLDEIAEISPGIQAKLLRVLQERTVRRLGGQREQLVDVRLVAATNIDPAKAVQQGKLREDLYYRISAISVHLPPLRERREDVLHLARAFLKRFASQAGRPISDFTPAAADRLRKCDWPGHVRQLQNEVQRAVLMCDGQMIDVHDLSVTDAPINGEANDQNLTLMEAMERNKIIEVLRETGGNKLETAKRLGIGRQTLYNKIKSYAIAA